MRIKNIRIISFLIVIAMLFASCGSGSELENSAELIDHHKCGDSVIGMTIDVKVQSNGEDGTFAVESVGMADQVSYVANNPSSIGANKRITLKITEVRVISQVGSSSQLQVFGDIV